MTMNIKSAEAHALAKDLAALEHTTLTDAVVISLREAVARRQAEGTAKARLERINSLAARFAEIDRILDGPSLWEINEDLYDENGLPR